MDWRNEILRVQKQKPKIIYRWVDYCEYCVRTLYRVSTKTECVNCKK